MNEQNKFGKYKSYGLDSLEFYADMTHICIDYNLYARCKTDDNSPVTREWDSSFTVELDRKAILGGILSGEDETFNAHDIYYHGIIADSWIDADKETLQNAYEYEIGSESEIFGIRVYQNDSLLKVMSQEEAYDFAEMAEKAEKAGL
jgi:hypothetical protein